MLKDHMIHLITAIKMIVKIKSDDHVGLLTYDRSDLTTKITGPAVVII